ncbi:hypothetical protein CRE_08415 [Caenorhabditis remanei]|uniref:Phlebovirus glycoprotein G2 fusion domain-containing protein n=1 Tax=Caenorhabditis remanei TaxID=31234 RepID=E3MPL9_CAERE|nr:hypothetical protein CRE_08415 [Caenorhabditis remanei]
MATWTENLMPNYICNRDLKKCYLDEQCQCSPAEDRMQCPCKDIDIREHFMQTDKRLPNQSGHLRFEVDHDSVKGKIKSASSTTLALKLTDKWKTTIVKTTEACTVTNSHAQGCYSCEKGAIAEITCHSTSEETVANELKKEPVNVLRKTVDEAQGSFRGTVTTISLFTELSMIITAHPCGAEAFGECVHDLIIIHNPFTGPKVYLSVSIESSERRLPLGTCFGILETITGETIADCLENSGQNLELNTPNVTIKLTYLDSP